MELRKANPPPEGERRFLDEVLEYSENPDVRFDDALQWVVAGYHTTANCEHVYFLFALNTRSTMYMFLNEFQTKY